MNETSDPRIARSREDGYSGVLETALATLDHRLTVRHRWVLVSFPNQRPMRQQGWKLHLSAHPGNSHAVLDRALSVLLSYRVSFKVAASPQMLEMLNAGAGGPSQIGKFITIYPADDEESVRVAEDLHTATRDMGGPNIPSDCPLHPGSLVHYRFGSFTGGALMQLADGTVASALVSPDGAIEPDERRPFFAPPAWAVNPFQKDVGSLAPVTLESPYRVLSLLSDTGRGSVWLGMDSVGRRRCILKTGKRQQGGSTSGLHREAAILRQLPPYPGWPAIYDMVETNEQTVLIMEDIDGVSLGDYVASETAYGRPFSDERLGALIHQLLDIVGALHRYGVVHRDLKASNILVTAEGKLRLIDFEHAAPIGECAKTGGTRGYSSPQQRAGERADLRDDVYAIGALIFLMSTGAEPSRAPVPANLLTRSVGLLNPDISLQITSVIESCLHPDDSCRLPDTAAVRAALSDSADLPNGGLATILRPRVPINSRFVEELGSEALLKRRAVQLADALCGRAVRDGGLLTWISTAPQTLPVPYRQINNGVAGILVALAACWSAFTQPRHRNVLVSGARWLARSEELPGAKVSACMRARPALVLPCCIPDVR